MMISINDSIISQRLMKAMMRKIQEMHRKHQCNFSTKILFIQQDNKDAWWFSESWKHSCNLYQNWMHKF